MSKKTGMERLQDAFNESDGKLASSNASIDKDFRDEVLSDSGRPDILVDIDTPKLEADDMWEYYYFMGDAPFLGD